MAGGGGAWKVAYADFVTAMMAFFLVMWITSQNDKVKEAIAEHFNEPDSIFESNESPEGSPSGVYRRGKKHPPRDSQDKSSKQKKDRGSPKPRAVSQPGGDRPGVQAVAFFVGDSAELDADSRERLSEFAAALAGKPQKIEVRGHTSRRPLAADSTYSDAWQLSYARCIAALAVLEKSGIAPERIRLSQAGKFEPYRAASGPQTHEQDPRVEVFLLNEILQDFVRTPAPAVTPVVAEVSAHH